MKVISLPIFNEVKLIRIEKAKLLTDNSTYRRLTDRLKVDIAKSSLFSRGSVPAYA